MPSVSRFYGIVIYFYYNDHNPPHFHAEYADSEASLRIDTLEVLEGSLPRRVHALVLEWAAMHRPELLDDWQLARLGLPLHEIPPLD